MDNVIVGVCVLAGIVGFQLAMRYWRTLRMKRCWLQANEALGQGDLATAEGALRKCVGLFPLWVPGRALLGAVLARADKLSDAEEEIRMAAELQPKDARGHLGLGMFYATRQPNRVEEAIDAFSKALECDPALRDRLAQEPLVQYLREHERFRALLG